MYGREISLSADDAEAFVANTQAAIDATHTESGELVGLPIDAEGHDKGDGAGWIIGVELVEGVIRLLPRWTEIGRELISKGIRRFFSATIDTSNKVVLGGTLTNWPATRDENNRLMLRPIELQDGLFTVAESEREPVDAAPLGISGDDDMAEEIVETEQEEVVAAPKEAELAAPPPESGQDAGLPKLPPDVEAELMVEFFNSGKKEPREIIQAVQKRAAELARFQVEDMLETREREWEITHLASQLVGGGKYGLPVGTVELASFLESLDADQFIAAKAIFEKVNKGGVIEFQERGHARRLRARQLPEVYHGPLKATLEAGNSIAAFFEVQDLGEPSDYDLSMFKEEK
jgi:hypothetical protein